MPRLTEGNLACDFPATWHATKYDDWAFYRNQFSNCCNDGQSPIRALRGTQAVDFLAVDTSQTLWLIELKDYRRHRRTKPERIWTEVALKARDTLAGLFAAKVAVGHPDHPFATRSLSCTRLRIVLHLEQPRTNSHLFPRAFDPADVQQKLKQLVKAIDAHPRVVELQNMTHVPWTAESIPSQTPA
ncbi:MAG: hypothetical protein WCQ21_34040 [Verrucomicrobiota bacterium]